MRTSVKYVLAFFLIIAALGIGLSLFGGSADARLCVWDGGDATSALASDPDNWDTDTAPVAGDNILFDGLNATGDDPCTWDLATNSFGTFTIAAGYTGTITQSSDMYITGYSQAGGVFTPLNAKWVYLNGNWSKTAGTLTSTVIKLNITDGTIEHNLGRFETVVFNGNINVSSNIEIPKIYNYGNITIASNKYVHSYAIGYGGRVFYNYGNIGGSGRLYVVGYGTPDFHSSGTITTQILEFDVLGTDTATIRMVTDLISTSQIYIHSTSVNGLTLDLNGHSLTASTITVGTRGILTNSAATVSEANCTTFDASNVGSTVTGSNIILNIPDNGTVKMKDIDTFKHIRIYGERVSLSGSVNATDGITFWGLTATHDYGYYENGLRLSTVVSNATGEYSLIGEQLTKYAVLKIKPMITIGDRWYSDTDGSRYNQFSVDIPYTLNITGTVAGWLVLDDDVLRGVPPSPDVYSYIITVTADNGETDIVTGYMDTRFAGEYEYSFTFVVIMLLWVILSILNFLGYFKDIPLLQILAYSIMMLDIVPALDVTAFRPFLLLLVLLNGIMFILGMVKYWQGRR